jgi:hypothetical protein
MKICDKYEIDPQEIDNKITYWESWLFEATPKTKRI